jgi:hypothetical protein
MVLDELFSSANLKAALDRDGEAGKGSAAISPEVRMTPA